MVRLDALTADHLPRTQRGLIRELLEGRKYIDVRVAALGSSTTNELVELFELLPLQDGLRPVFYQSSYNRYLVEAVLNSAALVGFKPNFVLIPTSSHAIKYFAADPAHVTLSSMVGAPTYWACLCRDRACGSGNHVSRDLAHEVPRSQTGHRISLAGRSGCSGTLQRRARGPRQRPAHRKQRPLVSEHYAKLGFECMERAPDGSASTWHLNLEGDYTLRNTHIRVLYDV